MQGREIQGKHTEDRLNERESHYEEGKTSGDLPLVSIVTPSFNQAAFLEETILSVLNQDYPNLEYLVVDGGSTDGSLEIIHRYAERLAWWVSEADCGQADAINKGFARARGEIFAWLNSDDTYYPYAVREAVMFLQQHPEVGMVYGDANFIDKTGRILGRFPARQTDYRRLRRGYVHIPQQAAFFRAELWQRVGPLDPSFYFAMDYDLWVRIARLSKITYLPRLWANFRLHDAAKTLAADERCWPEMLRVHYREGGSPFAIIVWKSWMRRLVAPYLRWKRRRMIGG
ncbi:MAG: glycosyltransferase family 2 protein [Anaerolineales bacterium]|nr:glycosyltransferase [Anaerolineales bacterium]MCS7248408.1 glycosyltransferase [Anaerolineales bacterium]MDW8162221.1 glycosyltransferase family 2 protein [Anaerolineales bacterium]MDW8446392.1 glycosyltransferase family 2 protein [Anaerolineales bacterium]